MVARLLAVVLAIATTMPCAMRCLDDADGIVNDSMAHANTGTCSFRGVRVCGLGFRVCQRARSPVNPHVRMHAAVDRCVRVCACGLRVLLGGRSSRRNSSSACHTQTNEPQCVRPRTRWGQR